MNFVLDACAMIAYLRGEPGADVVRSILHDPTNTCYAHAVNLCEVYYDFLRAADAKTAKAALRDLNGVGIHTRRDMSSRFWTAVGDLKGTIRRISLADCFAVQLSRTLKCEVVTSDHHEFGPLVALGVCRVRFIR
jgi:PIN domain nuclease of toxin-antitoxin system